MPKEPLLLVLLGLVGMLAISGMNPAGRAGKSKYRFIGKPRNAFDVGASLCLLAACVGIVWIVVAAV
ncbi:hypothetical protein H8E07_17770 [bacterium]|nr:hypothetical protein [bacterium]